MKEFILDALAAVGLGLGLVVLLALYLAATPDQFTAERDLCAAQMNVK